MPDSRLPVLQQDASHDGTHEPRLPLHAFPAPIVIPPLKPPHKQTIVFLHGRGSSARIFAPPLLSAPTGSMGSLRDALPHARFVFPSAPRSRATIYRRSIINQWYDGSGDWEETVLGHARETIVFLHDLLRDEVSLVGGEADRVVLGGFSQGCAAALVCLLLWEGEPLGGVVGFCGMLPMSGIMGDILGDGSGDARNDDSSNDDSALLEVEDDVFGPTGEENADPFDRDWGDSERAACTPLLQALNLLREEVGFPPLACEAQPSFPRTPVFLGHGVEDDHVSLRYGLSASRVLRMMGCEVDFRSYDGLSHWYSTDMLRDVLGFLDQKMFGSGHLQNLDD